MRGGDNMTTLLENRKNMKVIIVQYKLLSIIQELQKENEELKQKVEDLEYELEETKDNVGAKKLVLVKD